MDSHTYHVDVSWNEKRKGILCSAEIDHVMYPCIEVATPPEFTGGIAGIWSPEHLFTAAVTSCLMTTFLAIAENSKLPFSGFSCKSQGKLKLVDGKYVMSEIILEPVVTVREEKDKERAERVLRKSESACLISNSILSRTTMIPKINVSEQVQRECLSCHNKNEAKITTEHLVK
jgi:peroxiredoxin-like protein